MRYVYDILCDMLTNLQLIGFFGPNKPIKCKIVDSGLFPIDPIYTYFDLGELA